MQRKTSGRKAPSSDAQFVRRWLRNPLRTGAVFPSSRALGRLMASYVPLDGPTGAVVELGPGTGAITECLLERGVDEADLVLVEFSPEFCALLSKRYPRARIVEGDAYRPSEALRSALGGQEPGAVVSSLPLMARPEEEREAAVRAHLAGMAPGAPFIQFTYSPALPVRPERIGAVVEPSAWIARNLPPARVLVYRRP